MLSACSGQVGTATSWPGLTADQEAAYIAYNQFVYAVNLSNGLEKWRFPLEGNNQISYYAAPTLTSDGQLIVGDYKNTLLSLNPTSGQENWTYTQATDRYVGSALAAKDLIFAPNAGNHLIALDSRGNFKWSFETGGPLWAKPTTDEACECVYVASMDHHLYAVNAQTGLAEWQTDALGGSIVGTPALSQDGVLYAGIFGSEMIAISAEDGQVTWRTATDDWVWGGPTLQDNVLYFGDLSGNLYAVDASSGSIRWKQKPGGRITESPLVTEDAIYTSTDSGILYSLDLNGNIRWNKQFSGKLYTSPVVSGDIILVAATGSDELIYAIDANGNQSWAFIPETKK